MPISPIATTRAWRACSRSAGSTSMGTRPASFGWTPTARNRFGCSAASANARSQIPGPYAISTKGVTPTWCARSNTCWLSLSNRLSHRWQWVSIMGASRPSGPPPAARGACVARRSRPGHALQIDPREQDLRFAQRAAVAGAEARLRVAVLLLAGGAREPEQRPQRFALRGQHRPRPDRHESQRLEQRVQHRRELVAAGLVLSDLPRLRPVHELVRALDHVPHVIQRLVDAQLLPGLGRLGRRRGGRGAQGAEPDLRVVARERFGVPRRGSLASEELVHERHGPAREVAELVREVRVHVLDELFQRELAVAPGRERIEQVEAQRVGAERPRELDRVHQVAERLGKPLAARVDEAVHVDLARQRHPGREQQRRPQHAMKTDDVLSDQVERAPVVGALRARRGRPRAALASEVLELVLPGGAGAAHVLELREPPQRVLPLGPADRRQVVQERVGPHVRHVTLAALDLLRQRDAPRQVGARDADVLEPALDDVHDLVAAVVGPDEVGVGFDVLEERVVVLGLPQEETALLHGLRLHLVLGAAALLVQVLLGLERLAALAIQALVRFLVERVPAGLGREAVVEPPEELPHGQPVPGVRGAEELVVLDVERLPRGDERLRQLVHERGRGLAGGGRGASDLLAVLVRAGEVVGRVALLPVTAGNGIRENLLIGMAQVGPAIHVIDRRGDVETGHAGLRGGEKGTPEQYSGNGTGARRPRPGPRTCRFRY